jgi:hypothetical protein
VSLVWPTSLPASPLVEGWQGSDPVNVVETDIDGGPTNSLLVGFSTNFTTPIQMVLTADQLFGLDGFRQFYEQDSLHGTVEFAWRNPPIDADVTCRFRLPHPTWEKVGPDAWLVQFTVEYL